MTPQAGMARAAFPAFSGAFLFADPGFSIPSFRQTPRRRAVRLPALDPFPLFPFPTYNSNESDARRIPGAAPFDTSHRDDYDMVNALRIP
ncbi:hypothetical protein [Cupriavidus necator]